MTFTLSKTLPTALAATTLALLSTASAASAGSITTTFAGGNGQAGNMFDVTTFGNALLIESLEINVFRLRAAPGTLDVYTKPGSYIGFEGNAAAWTKVSSTSIPNSIPEDFGGTPIFVDITDFLLASNSLTGFYITFAGQSNFSPDNVLAYTNGSNTYSNTDLSLSLGVGKGGTFGATIASRTWNGTINYEVQPIPTPALLPGLIGMGVAVLRKRKAEAQS
jgi:hypothetical protein